MTVEIGIVMIAYALFLPVPSRTGVSILALVALVHPVVTMVFGLGSLTDIAFVVEEIQVIASFAIAVTTLALHNELFDLRHRVLESFGRHADKDPLTGAYNRRTLNERLVAECDRCRRYGLDLGVVMMDIDRFKQFNTDHGYEAGDAMLKALVAIIEQVTERPAYHRGAPLIARYGGEEFCVLLPSLTADETHAFAQELCREVAAARIDHEGERLAMTISAGDISVAGAQRPKASKVLAAVDAAMYRSKAAGGNLAQRAHPRDMPEAATSLRTPDEPFEPKLPMQATDDVRRDLYAIQLTAVGLLALASAFWVLLFIVEDVIFAQLIGEVFPLRELTAGRIGIALALLAVVVAIRFDRLRAEHTPLVHTLFLGMGLIASLVSMHYAGGLSSPYLSGTVFTVITWSLAFSASVDFSAIMLLTVVGTFWGFFILVEGYAPFDITLLQRTGAVFSAAMVSFGAQYAFSQMRREEVATRLALQDLARRDPLTLLGNRQAFEDRLWFEATRASETSPLSLVVLDLDHFKRLNDTLGHLAGDEALIEVAQIIGSELRGVDVVARLGGEEFSIALPHTDTREAAQVAERLRVAIASVKVANARWSLTASFGVATARTMEQAAQLLAEADVAVREAKRQGRDCVVTRQDASDR